MPRRVVDGDAIWTSKRLRTVGCDALAALLYVWILPLATGTGSFECDPELVWRTCFSWFVEWDISPQEVAQYLELYERHGLLFRWTENGRTYGYWAGIDKPGRLPPKSQINRGDTVCGPVPPQKELRAYLRKHRWIPDEKEQFVDKDGVYEVQPDGPVKIGSPLGATREPLGDNNASTSEPLGEHKGTPGESHLNPLLGFGSGCGLGRGVGEGKPSPLSPSPHTGFACTPFGRTKTQKAARQHRHRDEPVGVDGEGMARRSLHAEDPLGPSQIPEGISRPGRAVRSEEVPAGVVEVSGEVEEPRPSGVRQAALHRRAPRVTFALVMGIKKEEIAQAAALGKAQAKGGGKVMRDLTDIRPEWTEDKRIHEAYLCMAQKAEYRPQAPSDGLGHILLSDAELADPDRLKAEASDYAEQFIKEEDARRFNIGVSNYPTNRAFVYTIEAARLLCTGSADRRAATLLGMALKDVKTGVRRRRRR